MQFITKICEPSVRALIILIFLVTIPFSACKQKTKPQQAMAVPEVATIKVSTQPILLTTELAGRTSPYLVAEIRPQVNGLIKKRLFKEGSDVEAGELLYEIDSRPFQAAFESAKAYLMVVKKGAERARAALRASMAAVARHQSQLRLAIKSRERFEESFKERAVSASQRDQAVSEAEVAQAALQAAEAQVESDRKAIAAADASILQAEAALETARINLDYTNIVAPISGRIGRSNVTVGGMVTAYQPMPLATIQQLDPIYVDVHQSTTELLRLKRNLSKGRLSKTEKGQNTVRLLLEGGREYPFDGTLKFREVTVDPTTGSVTLRVIFPNPEDLLLPGMFVRAVVVEGFKEKAILIPQQAVSRDPKGNPLALLVDEEEKVRQRMLKIDRAVGDKWFVTAGLESGDRLIVEGLQKIRPGIPVKVISLDDTSKKRIGPAQKVQQGSQSNESTDGRP